MVRLKVLDEKSLTDSTANDSTLFTIRRDGGRPAIVSMTLDTVDASASTGSNQFTLRLYYSPNYEELSDPGTDADWIEAPPNVFKPIVLLDADGFTSTTYTDTREIGANIGKSKLVVQRHGSGTYELTVSAWVEL